MAEKRFVMNVGISNFNDAQTGKVYCEYNLDEVVDLLNTFNEENVLLKHIIKSVLTQAQYIKIREIINND